MEELSSDNAREITHPVSSTTPLELKSETTIDTDLLGTPVLDATAAPTSGVITATHPFGIPFIGAVAAGVSEAITAIHSPVIDATAPSTSRVITSTRSPKIRNKSSKDVTLNNITTPESEVIAPIGDVAFKGSQIPHDKPLISPANTELLFVSTETTTPTMQARIQSKIAENAIAQSSISIVATSSTKDTADTTEEKRYEKRYKEHVLLRTRAYEKRSLQIKRVHAALQLVILIGAAIVSITIGFQEVPKLIPAIISSIVTIATVVASYFKFGERSRDLYLTAEDLSQEYNWFDTKRSIYKNKQGKEALDLFMDRTEVLIRKQTQQSFALERAGEEQSNRTEAS